MGRAAPATNPRRRPMPGLLSRYARWLHTRWPAGRVEKLPEVAEDGSTRVPGLYVAGDLTGIPLLKFALDSGVRVVRRIASDPGLRADGGGAPGGTRAPDGATPRAAAAPLDLVIVGGG